MPNIRLTTKKYYFTVEGETEKWYFEHVQRLINSTEQTSCKVDFSIHIQRNPCAFVRNIPIISKTKITHIIDVEGSSESHIHTFKQNLDNMKNAMKLGKTVHYQLGYSNISFELWILLHKCYTTRSCDSIHQYLPLLNKAYGLSCESLDKFKSKKIFTDVLGMISLDDINCAIRHADKLQSYNEDNHRDAQEKYKSFQFYKTNPSLSLHETVKAILKDCSLV